MQVSVALLPVLFLPLFALPQEQPIVPEPEVSTEKFQVTGTVLSSTTGTPIRRALVMLECFPGSSQTLFTGEDGRFAFSGLSAGRCQISATRPGFEAEDARRLGERELRLGPSVSDKILKLRPMAVITGKVVNSDGEPIPGVFVQALSLKIIGGVQSATESEASRTDDRGEYRIADLSRGQYVVKAAGYSSTAMYLGERNPAPSANESYGLIFFPQAHDRASATQVQLAAGEGYRADFALTNRPAFRVRGTVNGLHLGDRAWVYLRQENGEELGTRSNVNPTTGAFEILDAPPGDYLIEVVSQSQADGNERVGLRSIQVKEREIAGVELTFQEPAHISVEIRGGSSTPADENANSVFSLTLEPESRMFRGSTDVIVGANRGSRAAAAGIHPGRYFVRLESGPTFSRNGDVVRAQYVERVRAGQTDVLSDGLTVLPGVTPPPLEIQLRTGGGTITGKVRSEGPIPPTCRVLILRETGGGVVPAMAYASNGAFSSGALVPGEYFVWAWEGDEVIEYRNPQALAAWKEKAAHVSLKDGASEEVELNLLAGGRP